MKRRRSKNVREINAFSVWLALPVVMRWWCESGVRRPFGSRFQVLAATHSAHYSVLVANSIKYGYSNYFRFIKFIGSRRNFPHSFISEWNALHSHSHSHRKATRKTCGQIDTELTWVERIYFRSLPPALWQVCVQSGPHVIVCIGSRTICSQTEHRTCCWPTKNSLTYFN